jgi:exopolysaccharide production protein ExoZ
MDAMSPFGGIGVSLFLILSGFCISHLYVGKSRQVFVWGMFVERRVVRIVPAYFVALAAVFTWIIYSGKKLDLFDVLTHLTLTHNFFPSYSISYGPYWTVALEMQLYLLFAIAMVLSRWVSKRTLFCLGISLWLGWRLLAIGIFGTGFVPATFSFTFSAFGRLLEFLVGVMIAYRWDRITKSNRLVKYQHFIAGFAAILILACMAIGSKIGATNPIKDVMLTAGLAMFFVLAIIPRTAISKMLSSTKLTRVGEATYSVYLFHALVIEMMANAFIKFVPRHGELVYLIATASICVLAGYVAYLVIEKPVMTWAKSWHKRPRSKVISTPAMDRTL